MMKTYYDVRPYPITGHEKDKPVRGKQLLANKRRKKQLVRLQKSEFTNLSGLICSPGPCIYLYNVYIPKNIFDAILYLFK